VTANDTADRQFATGISELERDIVEQASDRLDDSYAFVLNPGDDQQLEIGVGENVFRYSPDIVLNDLSTGRSIVIEVKGSISSAFAATLSRLRAIQRTVESKGNLFLLVMNCSDNEDNWLLRELARLNIDYVDATQPGAVAEKVATLAARLRHE
jgi:hypothetical protein